MSAGIRVCHIFGNLHVGGAEKRSLDLFEALNSSIWPRTEHVIATMLGETGELQDDFSSLGVGVDVFNIHSFTFPIRFFKYLRSNSFTAVHSHIHLAGFLPIVIARFAGVPVRIFHARTESDARKGLAGTLDRIRIELIRQFASVLAGVTLSSITSLFGSELKIGQSRVVLRNGVPPGLWRNDHASLRSCLVEDLGINANDILIAHVGRADIPTKNRERAVLLFEELSLNGVGCALVFVGRDAGAGVSQEEARGKLLGNLSSSVSPDGIHFLGSRSDVRRIVAASDVLLLTSSVEGVPGVVLEALAEGCPVVASDIPGVREIADRVLGVEVIPLSASDSLWSEAIQRQAFVNLDGRSGLADSFATSEFAIHSILESYLSAWGSSLEAPRRFA